MNEEDIKLAFEELSAGVITKRQRDELTEREAAFLLALFKARETYELSKLRDRERRQKLVLYKRTHP